MALILFSDSFSFKAALNLSSVSSSKLTQLIPIDCASCFWSLMRPTSGQITRIFGGISSQFCESLYDLAPTCNEHLEKKDFSQSLLAKQQERLEKLVGKPPLLPVLVWVRPNYLLFHEVSAVFTVLDSTVTMLIVSSHHATDGLSQLANQKLAFVGERCILKNSGVSCRLSFSSLFPSPLPSIFTRQKNFENKPFRF